MTDPAASTVRARRFSRLFWRAAAAFLILPGTIGFLVPWLLRPANSRFPIIGLPLLLLGMLVLLWCVRDFYVAGRGTLAPWSPPKHLVTVGLYRFSRNPMYVAVLLILAGWATLFASRTLWIYAGFVAIAFHVRVIIAEEPYLARTHGSAWTAYRAHVPRWLITLSMPTITIPGVKFRRRPSQCQKPRGPMGRVVLWLMNRRHSSVTDWGLQHIAIHERDTILDVGCGGGRTVAKLAAAASAGTTYGIDYSSASVDTARRINREFITAGRVRIEQESVLSIPFPDRTFDLVTAVETHFWWADLAAGTRECHRVLKPGGHMVVISEFYNGGKHAKYAGPMSRFTTMAVLNVDEHRAMFANAGFDEIVIDENSAKGWICVAGTRRLP